MSGRRFAKLAAVAAALVMMFPMTSAQAAEQDLEFVNTGGSFAIGATALTLDAGAGGIVGVWDDVSGDFVGSTQFNPIAIPADPPAVPVDVVINLDATSANNVVGDIDPATGDAALIANMQIAIEIPALGVTCTTPAFDVTFDTDPPDGSPFEPLPFDDSQTYTIGLQGSFTVPALVAGGCGAGQDALVGVVNTTLGLPTGGTAVLPLERGSVPPPPPTTPTTTGTTSTTAGAGASTAPRFTG
jgi:hypothetical protein